MNRTIKFRAWDNFNKEMMNDFNCYADFNYGVLTARGSSAGQFTLMQFTGLTDKNGKEIYEGDVVEYYDSTTMYLTAEVKWLHCGWSIQSDGMDGDDIELGDFELPGGSIEVIGNIYENPELTTK